MAAGYRNAAGVDFDDLFEAGATAATNFRRSDGTALRYAARGTVPKGPNVGYRLANGTDLSNLWLPKGSAPPVPGFNGATYEGFAAAPSGATGTTSATVRLTFLPDGTWVVDRTIAGSATGNGVTTLATGTWLPAGQSASNYTVRFAATGSGGTESNGATTAQAITAARTFSLQASVNSATTNLQVASRTVTASLTRTGAGTSAATCTLDVEAQGQV